MVVMVVMVVIVIVMIVIVMVLMVGRPASEIQRRQEILGNIQNRLDQLNTMSVTGTSYSPSNADRWYAIAPHHMHNTIQ
jgi:type II secretory pathway pseudopilin PulG